MKLFVDSADISEIRELAATGLVDGVTTNPSLVAKSGRDFRELLADIANIVDGPVSAEVVAETSHDMIREGKDLAQIAENIVIKTPLTWEGIKATRHLSGEGVKVNVTLCFSVAQALAAAKAGATYISPFIGRLDDQGEDGMALIHDIRAVYENYFDALKTEILAASIRSVAHVGEAAIAGADCATIPPAIMRDIVKHPLTDKGLAAFLSDWKKTGQTI